MTNFDNWITLTPSEYEAYNGIKETDNICDCDFCKNNIDIDTDTDEMPCGCAPEDFCKCKVL